MVIQKFSETGHREICGRLTAGIAGSIPAVGWMLVSCFFFVRFVHSGLCDGLITGLEESDHVCV